MPSNARYVVLSKLIRSIQLQFSHQPKECSVPSYDSFNFDERQHFSNIARSFIVKENPQRPWVKRTNTRTLQYEQVCIIYKQFYAQYSQGTASQISFDGQVLEIPQSTNTNIDTSLQTIKSNSKLTDSNQNYYKQLDKQYPKKLLSASFRLILLIGVLNQQTT